MPDSSKLLVTVLNWGLGHAARMIPLIQYARDCGHAVWLASDGPALTLLQKEFPDLPCLQLPSYHIRYPFRSMTANMLYQAPKMGSAIRQTSAIVEKWVDQYQFNAIWSDNRYGAWSKKVPSVFLTHQLAPQTPYWWQQKTMSGLIRRLIRPFSEVWIFDEAAYPSLAGRLSHPSIPINNLQFLGLVSRLRPMVVQNRIPLLAVLSGPEPQRSRLEAEIRPQLANRVQPAVLVRGLPDKSVIQEKKGTLKVYNYLDSHRLNALLAGADVVLARSGYTTIMDLVSLGKRAILIPTPGQSEQEYLAKLHAGHPQFVMAKQGRISLPDLWFQASQRTAGEPSPERKYQEVLDGFFRRITG